METFSASLAICSGNSLVTGEFPAQRPATQNFNVFFDLRLKKRLSKQFWGWWFETPSRPLWRHCNKYVHECVLHTSLYPCPRGWKIKTDDNRLDPPGPRLCAAFCLNRDLFIVFSLLTFAVMLIFIKHWKLIINDIACTDKSTHDYSFISDV